MTMIVRMLKKTILIGYPEMIVRDDGKSIKVMRLNEYSASFLMSHLDLLQIKWKVDKFKLWYSILIECEDDGQRDDVFDLLDKIK